MLSRKILIVDDDAAIVEMIAAILDKTSYKVLKACDGEEALRIASEELPSLILLDIQMPKKNGLEVCKELKANPSTRQIPIIILTASVYVQEIETAVSYGVKNFITKPSHPKEILQAITSILK